jgi:hypothetical protein
MNAAEFPEELLAHLAACEGGGATHSVATSPGLKHPVPHFLFRAQVGAQAVDQTPFGLLLRLETLEPEGPLVICHLYLYDRQGEIDLVELRGDVMGVRVEPAHPFMCECFLNPGDPAEREMLTALAESPYIRLAFFLDRPDLPFQGGRDYPNDHEWRRAAREILERTHAVDVHGAPEAEARFHAAVRRYQSENPLF